MKIELSYINTNHPDFTDGASLVSTITMNHEIVRVAIKQNYILE